MFVQLTIPECTKFRFLLFVQVFFFYLLRLESKSQRFGKRDCLRFTGHCWTRTGSQVRRKLGCTYSRWYNVPQPKGGEEMTKIWSQITNVKKITKLTFWTLALRQKEGWGFGLGLGNEPCWWNRSVCIRYINSASVILEYNWKWFEPRSELAFMQSDRWVCEILKRTVIVDWRFVFLRDDPYDHEGFWSQFIREVALWLHAARTLKKKTVGLISKNNGFVRLLLIILYLFR